jgi:hypothetical protein
MEIDNIQPVKFYLRNIFEKQREAIEQREQALFDISNIKRSKSQRNNNKGSLFEKEDNDKTTEPEQSAHDKSHRTEQNNYSEPPVDELRYNYRTVNGDEYIAGEDGIPDSIGKKLAQVFRYLLELKRMNVPIVRDIDSYREKYWWVRDLPLSPKGCHILW